MKIRVLDIALVFSTLALHGQHGDSISGERFSIHAQMTVINQTKAAFSAKYSGINSLITQQENQTSITSTLFMGLNLWKGASLYLNPEIAGGSGLSKTLGIAAATNGETFRVASTAPQIYLARFFFKQIFALSSETVHQSTDFNQLAGKLPVKYISVTAGKVGIADYFDDNAFSHDPRTQFMCWALMSNGAWDYPANTRGYTPSLVLEFVTKKHELRYGFSLMPTTANGNTMNWDISKAGSHTLEYTHKHEIKHLPGTIRILAFYTVANMGNYRESIALNPNTPVIEDTRQDGRTKYGFGVNAEQNLNPELGCFFRASWNDGNNETWAFTEIDRSLSAGFTLNGAKWKRKNDNLGLAYVVSGISAPHRDYLKAGGKGFMLGDGNLNYAWEQLGEIYYSAELREGSIYLSAAYQLLLNPAYNIDRHGPVNVFSVRVHARI